MIPTILGVLLIIFTINELMPGDPAMARLGTNYTEEAYQEMREEMGLNRPFVTRYVDYVVGFFSRLDLGESYSSQRPVKTLILERIWVSIKLGLMGSAITIIFGVLIGVISAVKQYSVLDYAITVLATFFASMPGFWLALMGIIVFSQELQWLPAAGLYSWKHYIMPVICIGITPIALVVRMTRTSMLDVIRQDYIRTARAKGLKERTVIYKHALRNALIPVITVIGMQLTSIFGGSIIVESIYSIPGMGVLLLTAINSRDFTTIQGTVLVLSLAVCVINLLVDIAYALADPRIKAQYVRGKKTKAPPAAAVGSEEKEGEPA